MQAGNMERSARAAKSHYRFRQCGRVFHRIVFVRTVTTLAAAVSAWFLHKHQPSQQLLLFTNSCARLAPCWWPYCSRLPGLENMGSGFCHCDCQNHCNFVPPIGISYWVSGWCYLHYWPAHLKPLTRWPPCAASEEQRMSLQTDKSSSYTSPGVPGMVSDWSADKQTFDMPWGKLMMWIFLLSDTFIFSVFLTGYMHARLAATEPWPNSSEVFALTLFGSHLPLVLIAIMTFVLITSSGTMAMAVNFAYSGNRSKTVMLMAATALLGASFRGHAGLRMVQIDF